MTFSEENYQAKLGQSIENMRTSKRYSTREFALLADIEHHQLINIEKGRVDIRFSTLIKIAKAFEVEPKVLLEF